MDKPKSQIIEEFFDYTSQYAGSADNLPVETAIELYDMYDDMAKLATGYIADIPSDYRVMLCAEQDELLERIVDDMPELKTHHKNIYTPAVKNCDRWRNVELMKDCGLVVYMLGKEMNLHPVMLYGRADEDYPYLDILNGLELLTTDVKQGTDDEPADATVYYKHLEENFEKMDVLALYGLYPKIPNYLNMYRQYRPDGTVYLALDMNRHWMGRTDWGSDLVRHVTSQCDLIATSSRSMRDALNANPQVSFPCRWFTNGFYNPTGLPVIADPDVKENIILTAGNIGTRQKNNLELLIAFAIAADDIPDWSVRLAGGIDPEFLPVIDSFYEKCPHLKERVIFTGAITDKSELYKEYARAKIFAMTSTFECFPNVYAEALFHGCMFLTSDIDPADDMTKSGELGMTYPLGETATLAASLIKMAQNAGKADFEKHIPKALAYANRYYDWHRNAKKLAYMLFKS